MNMKEKIARAIAEQIGYDYDKVFEHKQEWVAEGGMRDGRFHDVNEPYRSDFDCAADAVLDALMEPSNDMLEAMFVAMFDAKFTGAELPMMGAGFEAAIQAAKDGK